MAIEGVFVERRIDISMEQRLLFDNPSGFVRT